jgi:hypothetical protein
MIIAGYFYLTAVVGLMRMRRGFGVRPGTILLGHNYPGTNQDN